MNAPIKVFLAGEGKNELGGRIGPPAFHNPDQRGVIEALLQKICPDGWVVGGACEWKRIRKFKAHGPVDAETRAVLGAALDARESQCHVLAFCRDQDKDENRQRAIDTGIERVQQGHPSSPAVIGGIVIPKLEGWILALLCYAKTEAMSPNRADEKLVEHGVAAKDTEAMVRIVDEANLNVVPPDATSLHQWLARARVVMQPSLP